MIEEDFVLNINNNEIHGTYCRSGSVRCDHVVLFVHGSGPLDRNENTKVMDLNVFNQIAHHLADHGVASFRYDKRGCGKSTGNYIEAGHHDLVNDAKKILIQLRDKTVDGEADIYVLGHSEGTLIAAQLASTSSSVAGIILLCPFAQPLKDILRSQGMSVMKEIKNARGMKGTITRALLKLSGNPLQSQEKLIEAIESSTEPTISVRRKNINAKWFRDLFEIDAVEIYEKCTCPVLIIGGEKDLQCDPNDVEKIRNILKSDHIETHLIEDMTHILRRDFNEPSLSSYSSLRRQDLDNEVLQLIQDWIQRERNILMKEANSTLNL